MLVSPRTCAALDELAAEPGLQAWWLTSWSAEMRERMHPFPGQNWPSLTEADEGPRRAREWAGDRWGARPWWKDRGRRALQAPRLPASCEG